MKRGSTMLASIALVLLPLVLPSQLRTQTFEGVIEFTATSTEGTVPITYMVKGNNVRVETEGRPGMKAVFLIDVKANKSVMIVDAMKMYMETPQSATGDSAQPKSEITKTGKTQKILGYDCEEFLVKEGEQESDVWVTKELGAFELFRMGGNRQRSNAEAWQKAIGGKGGFPLLAVTKTAGKDLSSLKATKVEKKSLDDSMFKIPDGYQKFDSSMMRRPR